MTSSHLAFVLCRFLNETGALLIWGAFGYLVSGIPSRLACYTSRRLDVLAAVAVAVTVISSICLLPIRTAMIGGGWSESVDPRTLWLVTSSTSVGKAWLVNFLASLWLLAAFFIRRPYRDLVFVVFSGLLLSSLAMTGHAMMHEGWLGYLQQANDIVHVLASGAWLGALVPLSFILGTLSVRQFADHCDIAVRRFSRAGRVAVILILVSGLFNTLLIVGGFPFDWSAPYQVLLCLKVAVVLVMIGLAGRNHSILGPRMKRDRAEGASAIRRAAIGEMGLGATAVFLVAIFGTLAPGHGV